MTQVLALYGIVIPFSELGQLYSFFLFGCTGLQSCAQAFSSCCEQGLLFIAVASPVAEHSQGAWASVVAAHGLFWQA